MIMANMAAINTKVDLMKKTGTAQGKFTAHQQMN